MSVTFNNTVRKPVPVCLLLQDDDFCPVHHKGQCRRPDKTVPMPAFEEDGMNGDADADAVESGSDSDEEEAKKLLEILSQAPPPVDDNAPSVLTMVYAPGGTLPKLSRYLYKNIEIRVPSKHLSTRNKEVSTRQVWGTDVYTDDSDIVAILMHTGRMVLRSNPPSNNLGVSVTLRVLPGQSNYISSTRFNFKSRPWASTYTKCSLSVIKSEIREDAVMWAKPKHVPTNDVKGEGQPTKKRAREIRLMRTAQVEPPSTRPPKPKRRFMTDATIVFNSWNEPCFKYSLGLVGDRGMDESEWTSARLKKEAIYCEESGTNKRYELSRESDSEIHGIQENGKIYDSYRWAEVISPITYQPIIELDKVDSLQNVAIPPLVTPSSSSSSSSPSTTTNTTTTSSASKKRKVPVTPNPTVPLPPSSLNILESHVDWDAIEWGPTSVRVKGREYVITTIQFKPITSIE